MPARYGSSIIVWLRQLLLYALELTRWNPNGSQHVRLGGLMGQAVSDLLFHLLGEVLLNLLKL